MKTVSAISLLLFVACTTNSKVQSEAVFTSSSETLAVTFAKTSNPSNEKLIDALVAAPNLYVKYVEDGAADNSVLAIYEDGSGNVTNQIAKEVKDIIALRDRAIPLLIEHLDDTRPTTATTSQGGYLTDRAIRVPVGHICLDILINIVGVNNKLIYNKEIGGGFGGGIKDGFYFRPDDYRVINDDKFIERAIVRIVKANWQKAYRDGKIKFNYLVKWK
jgi:hypothetical protein